MTKIDTAFADAVAAKRVNEFTQSEMFLRTFQEGMTLVEETAAYLDGPGRAASKQLPRLAALAYAGETMRLTTRLMQVASWLMVQRAVREGSMSLDEAREGRYRFTERDARQAGFAGADDLPEALRLLMNRSESLFERVRRLDAAMYAEAEEPPANPVADHMARLQAAFLNRG